MNNKKGWIVSILVTIVLFAAGVGLALAASQYPKTLAESGSIRVELNAEKPVQAGKPIVVDIKKQGLPKRLFQPGRISISTGHAAGISNKGTTPLNLAVHLEGLPENTKLTSTDQSFDSSSGVFKKPISAGNAVALTIGLKIPRRQISSNYQVASGKLLLINLDTGGVLSEIPISVINSSVQK